MKSLATWALIQSATAQSYGTSLLSELQEIDLHEWRKEDSIAQVEAAELVFDRDEEEVSMNDGEIAAEVIQATRGESPAASTHTVPLPTRKPLRSMKQVRQDMRRYSKLCLSSYGGMGLIFFGMLLYTFQSQL